MNKVDEAFNILGLPRSVPEDELKAKYKELAKKFHPDVYKEDPEKFKKINEAYQLIQDYKANPSKYERKQFQQNNVGFQYNEINLQDLFNNFHNNFTTEDNEGPRRSPNISAPPPTININISFKESILGNEKQITYKRYLKCTICNGIGLEYVNNGCQSCNGFGRIVANNKGMVFSKVCTKCYGKNIKKNKCSNCNVKGVMENDVAGTVQIPPGIVNGTTLRLAAAGHYMGNSLFGDSYGDVFIRVTVDKDLELELMGSDVVSHVNLSLLDALIGSHQEIKTVHGTRNIAIPALTKNKDELRIQDCGVKGTTGVQRVILDVRYPDDTKALVEWLKNSQN